MDDVFHAASAVLLARGLGEKRRPVLALAAVVSWRIAFGGLLHLAIDHLTHASSGVNELVPFLGLDWWRGRGLILWAAMWLGVIAAALVFFLSARRKARRPV